MTSSHIQSHGRSTHAKSWHVNISQVTTSACIPGHANALIILEFKIMIEQGSANVVILKKIIIVTQLLQLKSATKPTNEKGFHARL